MDENNTKEELDQAAEEAAQAMADAGAAASEPQQAPAQPAAAGFCTKCGAALMEGMPFCGSCGAKVDDAAAPEGGEAPAEAAPSEAPATPVEGTDELEAPAAAPGEATSGEASGEATPAEGAAGEAEAAASEAPEAPAEGATTKELATVPAPEPTPTAGFCPKCGTPLKEGMPFCGSCGAKIEKAPAATASAKKKNFKPVIGIAIVLVLVIGIAALVLPDMLATPDDLLEQGKYEAAYNKASDDEKPDVLAKIIGAGQFKVAYDLVDDDEKDKVLAANVAAVVSADLVNTFKGTFSNFLLDEVYFDKDANEIAFKSSMTRDSNGDSGSTWWDIRYDDDDNEYERYAYVFDLEDETIYTYSDTLSEKAKKYVNNAVRENIRNMMRDDNMRLDDAYVNGINQLSENDALDKVKLLDEVTQIYPNGADESGTAA